MGQTVGPLGGGVGVAPGTSGNVLTSNGTIWTSAAPSGPSTANVAAAGGLTEIPLWSGGPSFTPVGLTPSTTAGNIARAVVPVAGTYKIKFYIGGIYITAGSGNTITIANRTGTALVAYHTASTGKATIIADGATIGTYDKGSALAAGDMAVISSSSFSLAAGDLVTQDALSGLVLSHFTFICGGTLNFDAYVIATLAKQ